MATSRGWDEALAKGRSPRDYTIQLGQKPVPWAVMARSAVSLQAAGRRLDEKA